MICYKCENVKYCSTYKMLYSKSKDFTICKVRWDKEEGFSYFSNQFGYRPLVGNYKKMYWADIRQTVQGELKFKE